MKDYIYIFVSLLIASIFYGCNNSVSIKESCDASNDSVIIEDSTDSVNTILVPTIGLKKAGRNITDADSLETFFCTDGKCEKPLFSIVSGGNIVCMNDSMLDIDNAKYALFTIADYGQEDQIYYVLYNIADERMIQSERINLPFLGL